MQEIFDVNTYDTPRTLNVSSLFLDFKGILYVIFSKVVKFFGAPRYSPIFCCRHDFRRGLLFETHTKLKITIIVVNYTPYRL